MRRDDEAEMYQIILDQIHMIDDEMMERIELIRAGALAEGSVSAVAEIDRIRDAIIQTRNSSPTRQ